MPLPATLDTPLPSDVATGNRVIKTHVEARHFPVDSDARMVVVIRHPLDAFVSGYIFFHSVLNGFVPHRFTVDEWLDLSMTSKFFFGSWAAHTASWWGERERENVLIVTFAEMKRDLGGVVDKVTAHMGVTLNDMQREVVVERSGFGWMKANTHRFDPPIRPLEETDMVMIREGKVGQNEAFLTQAQRERLLAHFRREFEALDSDFPMKELFGV